MNWMNLWRYPTHSGREWSESATVGELLQVYWYRVERSSLGCWRPRSTQTHSDIPQNAKQCIEDGRALLRPDAPRAIDVPEFSIRTGDGHIKFEAQDASVSGLVFSSPPVLHAQGPYSPSSTLVTQLRLSSMHVDPRAALAGRPFAGAPLGPRRANTSPGQATHCLHLPYKLVSNPFCVLHPNTEVKSLPSFLRRFSSASRPDQWVVSVCPDL